MKKIIALSAAVVVLTASFASASSLTTGGVSGESKTIYGGISTGDSSGTTATLIGKLSKNVKLGVAYGTGGYALDTKHSSGNTRYGTAHDATAIYKQEIGSTDLAAPGAASYSAFSTWTAM
ncbi:hypothetical protein [Geomonas anaerohicana]|uniref:Porin domain-containing protein n=1 Tax=Geomonas anaerohicana TaxID=2798583 RepID=A0ABS0YGM4_9BACT|nr:hypothetical protein [Geomonas anaerohicana]MBJ6751441.1 hypothetical protein [Geomonas anaerohicana]